MPDTTDLYTTVKNVSGAARFYGYLGRHGRQLANNGQFTFYGPSIPHAFGFNKRKQDAFERDLLAGKITVLSTPRPIIKDTTPDTPLANPTVQATVATSTGGSLAVGFYKAAYTIINLWGETTVGTSLSAELSIPDATNDRMVVTTPATSSITGATGINIYVTAMAASGPAVDATTLRKVGTITGATTTFNVDTLPAISGSNPQPPAANTTDGPEMHGLQLTDGVFGVVDPSWGRHVVA